MNFPPIESIVPHRPPMILVDDLVQWDDHGAECTLTVREDAPFVSNGVVPAAVFLEYMAQTVAAFAGYAGSVVQNGNVRIGYLLGAREFDLHVASASVGDKLLVRIRRQWGDDMIGSFKCEVEREGSTLATATLTVYQGDLPEGVE